MVDSSNMQSNLLLTQRMISRLLSSLSLLKVKLHDGKAKQGCKKHCECHHHGSHPPQPAVLEVEVVLDEHLHGAVPVFHLRHDVTEL